MSFFVRRPVAVVFVVLVVFVVVVVILAVVYVPSVFSSYLSGRK